MDSSDPLPHPPQAKADTLGLTMFQYTNPLSSPISEIS